MLHTKFFKQNFLSNDIWYMMRLFVLRSVDGFKVRKTQASYTYLLLTRRYVNICIDKPFIHNDNLDVFLNHMPSIPDYLSLKHFRAVFSDKCCSINSFVLVLKIVSACFRFAQIWVKWYGFRADLSESLKSAWMVLPVNSWRNHLAFSYNLPNW